MANHMHECTHPSMACTRPALATTCLSDSSNPYWPLELDRTNASTVVGMVLFYGTRSSREKKTYRMVIRHFLHVLVYQSATLKTVYLKFGTRAIKHYFKACL
jgi:hypothetical protein